MELTPGANRTALCRCPPGKAQHARDSLCHSLYSTGPCPRGQYFAPVQQYVSFMVLKYKLKTFGFYFKYIRAYDKNMSFVKLSECLETQNVNSVFSDFLKCQQQFSYLNLGYGGLLQQ